MAIDVERRLSHKKTSKQKTLTISQQQHCSINKQINMPRSYARRSLKGQATKTLHNYMLLSCVLVKEIHNSITDMPVSCALVKHNSITDIPVSYVLVMDTAALQVLLKVVALLRRYTTALLSWWQVVSLLRTVKELHSNITNTPADRVLLRRCTTAWPLKRKDSENAYN